MNRILRQYTVVPKDLYVERRADRQLRDILNDMERPGYVLVARQMGKTNMLLHAKREYESSKDIYTYIDLSHSFDNELDCFENIVDTIVDTHEDYYKTAKEKISEVRSNKEKSAQRKHLEELRILLKNTENKLVIILDEIDALTKTTYSDNIFAQIRSIYFQRLNYPELSKLTYILSGVMEPSDIIKNPKISPFNIGQKIYLTDFSHEEFKLFIKQAGIDNALSEEILDRIFYWTNGNPRITWDLCYEIEGAIDRIKTINDVDLIVQKIYLTNYNKPPIDNIRDLVIVDKELREAIIQIYYGKEQVLSDQIKNKLYLAGITAYQENNISIKNRIIERSLSLNWLQQIEKQEKDLLQIALEYISREDFSNGLNVFEEFLDRNEFDDDTDPHDVDVIYYQMGYAAYRLQQMDKALNFLLKSKFDEQTNYVFFAKRLNLLGLVYFFQNKIDESLSSFEKIISNKEKIIDDIYLKSLINYSSIIINHDKEKIDEAESIFDRIISEELFVGKKINESLKKSIMTVAYFNKATIFSNESGAIQLLTKSILTAEPNVKCTIYLEILKISKRHKDRSEAIEKIITYLSTKNNRPDNRDLEKSLDFNIDRCSEFLFFILRYYKKRYFDKIKPFLKWYDPNSIANAIGIIASTYMVNNNNSIAAMELMQDIYINIKNKEYNISDELKFNTIRLLALYEDSNKTELKSEYAKIFKTHPPLNIKDDDIYVFFNLIRHYIQRRNYKVVVEYIEIIESVFDKVESNDKWLYTYLLYYKAIVLFNDNKRESLLAAREIITYRQSLSDNVIKEKFNANDMNEILNTARKIIFSLGNKKPN